MVLIILVLKFIQLNKRCILFKRDNSCYSSAAQFKKTHTYEGGVDVLGRVLVVV